LSGAPLHGVEALTKGKELGQRKTRNAIPIWFLAGMKGGRGTAATLESKKTSENTKKGVVAKRGKKDPERKISQWVLTGIGRRSAGERRGLTLIKKKKKGEKDRNSQGIVNS